MKKHEINIRQSLGEAVPTEIFRQIAKNIYEFLSYQNLSDKEIEILIKDKKLNNVDSLIELIKNNTTYSFATLARIVELANINREENEAYFTNKSILNDIYAELPNIQKDEINILEPSVGIGNFLPFIIKKYEDKKVVNIDVFDINPDIIKALKELIKKYEFPKNIHISFYNANTLLHIFSKHYDLTIGNPPFANATGKELCLYQKEAKNKVTKNLAAFFLEKAISLSDYVVMITPKTFLNTPEFEDTRDFVNNYNLSCILDFGEKGFKNVLIETICFFINTQSKPLKTKVVSVSNNIVVEQKQSYITDKKLPYWIIYRDKNFDNVFNNMTFDIFTVFRDRQITNSNSSLTKTENSVRVIKSRNISDDGKQIEDILNYDTYINNDVLQKLTVNQYIDAENVYLSPNMTYKPRVCKKPKGVVVNGSVAILIPKDEIVLSDEDMQYFSTTEYRDFYKTARNYQTRSLNIDKSSVFFFGIRRKTPNNL